MGMGRRSPSKCWSVRNWKHQSICRKETCGLLHILFLTRTVTRSEEHTSELQSLRHLVCRLLLERYGDHRDLHSFPTRRSSDLCVIGNINQYVAKKLAAFCTSSS